MHSMQVHPKLFYNIPTVQCNTAVLELKFCNSLIKNRKSHVPTTNNESTTLLKQFEIWNPSFTSSGHPDKAELGAQPEDQGGGGTEQAAGGEGRDGGEVPPEGRGHHQGEERQGRGRGGRQDPQGEERAAAAGSLWSQERKTDTGVKEQASLSPSSIRKNFNKEIIKSTSNLQEAHCRWRK